VKRLKILDTNLDDDQFQKELNYKSFRVRAQKHSTIQRLFVLTHGKSPGQIHGPKEEANLSWLKNEKGLYALNMYLTKAFVSTFQV
jgi:hypothetical protein